MSQPEKKDRCITGSSYVKPVPFSTKYKDYFYAFFTIVIMIGMLLGFLDIFARSEDVTELKHSLYSVQEKHQRDYITIDRKLDRILYHLIGSSHDPIIMKEFGENND